MLFLSCIYLVSIPCIYSAVKNMQYTKLGSSDLLVSKVCLGSMTWGQQNTLAEGVEQMNIAFDEYGINFLDTAEMYPVPTKAETQGETDRIISSFLSTRDRSKVILATKVSGPGITWLPGRNSQKSRVSAKEIELSIDFSLKRLGTDYVDLLQIHWPDRYVPIFGADPYNTSLERDAYSFEEQLIAMDKVIKAGKVRYFGLSNETPYGVMKFAQLAEKLGLARPVSIQNSYSLLTRSDYEAGLIEVCSPRNENVGLMAYSPLSGGILTGKYSDEEKSRNARLNLFPGYMARYKQSLTQEAAGEYVKVASKHNMTPAELALTWIYSRPHVASTIIGATTVSQLRENIEAYGRRGDVSDEVLKDIQNVYKRYRDPSLRSNA